MDWEKELKDLNNLLRELKENEKSLEWNFIESFKRIEFYATIARESRLIVQKWRKERKAS